jgi:carbon monoxide dehydrogenase subunit G
MLEVVSVSDEIAAPVGEVWAIVAAYGAVRAWMPDVESCVLAGDGGIGSLRKVKLKGVERPADERLERVDPAGHVLVYRLLQPARLPVEGLEITIALTPLGEGATRLVWSARAEAVGGGGVEAVAPVMAGFYRNCLAGLKRVLREGAA